LYKYNGMIPESLSGNRLISDNISIDIMNPFTKQSLSPGNHSSWSLTIDQFKEMDRLATEQYFLPIELMMENAGLQLARAIAFGVKPESIGDPDVFVDAYFGFSQRLLLPGAYVKAITWAEQLDTIKN